MTPINTTITVKNLKGEDIIIDAHGSKFTFGEAIADALLSYQPGGKMKCFVLAQKLVTDKVVLVDSADYVLIKAALEASNASNLITGQILVYLEENRYGAMAVDGNL